MINYLIVGAVIGLVIVVAGVAVVLIAVAIDMWNEDHEDG